MKIITNLSPLIYLVEKTNIVQKYKKIWLAVIAKGQGNATKLNLLDAIGDKACQNP